MEKPPLKLANDKGDQQRALQKREERIRRSSADERESYAPGLFLDEEDDDTTPQERRDNHRDWYTMRYGDLHQHISDEITRQELFVEGGYVVKHRGRTYDRDYQNVTNGRTPSPETHATAEDPSPTPDVDVNEVTLGAHGDKPLEVRSGVVVPAGFYIVIDGAAGDRYEAAQGFQGWYGFYGAEHYMREGSIARSFPWVPGEDMPIDRAHSMENDLRRQSHSRSSHRPAR
jgi:hypothetical protein